MAGKKKEKKTKDKRPFKEKLKSFISKNKVALIILSLIVLLGGGVGLIVTGYLEYNRATREAYVVAGMKAMEDGNFHKAQSLLLKATYLQAPEAYPFLAWLSAKAGNFTKALDYCRETAKYPEIHGAYEVMGYLSLLGYGNAQGAGSALFYFDEAMKSYSEEYLKSHNPLLAMYEKSISLCMNKQDYIRMVDEAQKKGSNIALLYRGDLDFLGEENDLSPKSAAKSWEDAKNNGVLEAQTRLASLLWYGYGKRRDYRTAMRYFEDAAKKHEPAANYSLGLIRLRQGKKTSYAEGMRYLKNAAKMNYGPALTAVGVNAIIKTKDFSKIASAAADIFKQAYDCGDTTGGILYALMMMNGMGIATDQTEALSILYDLKTRGVQSVGAMLKYFTYNNEVDSKRVFNQAIALISDQYLGKYTFAEGAPEAKMYHEQRESGALSYYISQKDDRDRYTDEFIADLGKNYVEKLDKPEDIEINGEKLLYPEITQILDMYNPTTGAKPFMPQAVMEISATMPKLPPSYDKYEIDFDTIMNNFEDFY